MCKGLEACLRKGRKLKCGGGGGRSPVELAGRPQGLPLSGRMTTAGPNIPPAPSGRREGWLFHRFSQESQVISVPEFPEPSPYFSSVPTESHVHSLASPWGREPPRAHWASWTCHRDVGGVVVWSPQPLGTGGHPYHQPGRRGSTLPVVGVLEWGGDGFHLGHVEFEG